MREIIVPIDLTQEEREILAIFSKRQFMLVLPAVVIGFGFLVWGFIPFINPWVSFFIRLLITLVIIGFATASAFVKLDKYELYLSEYINVIFRFSRSQKTFFH